MRLCLVVLVLSAALSPIAWAEGSPTWGPGMYWTYDATTTWTQTDSGHITLIVLRNLKGESPFSPDVWVLAGIRDWWSGGEKVTPVTVLGSLGAYVRWPILANLLPRADVTSLHSALTFQACYLPPAPGNQPVHLGTTWHLTTPRPAVRPGWLDGELDPWMTTQSIALVPGAAAELLLPDGSFAGAVPIEYEWEGGGDRNSGVAWWVPELLAWGRVEGREQLYDITGGYRYTITLAEQGRLSEEEMKDRLRSALERMEPFDREEAQGWRALLVSFGFEL